jgi:hypothetical protein
LAGLDSHQLVYIHARFVAHQRSQRRNGVEVRERRRSHAKVP